MAGAEQLAHTFKESGGCYRALMTGGCMQLFTRWHCPGWLACSRCSVHGGATAAVGQAERQRPL